MSAALVVDAEGSEAFDRGLRAGNRLVALWLHGGAEGEAALEVPTPGLDLGDNLAALFRRVETLARSGAGAPATPWPFDDGAFDLVTAWGYRPRAHEAAEMRRVLRDGGTALVAVRNRWWPGRLRRREGTPRSGSTGGPGLARRLRQAGFQTVWTYLAAPGLADPRVLVPARGAGMAAWEAWYGPGGARGGARRLVAGAGLGHLIMPVLVFVGRA